MTFPSQQSKFAPRPEHSPFNPLLPPPPLESKAFTAPQSTPPVGPHTEMTPPKDPRTLHVLLRFVGYFYSDRLGNLASLLDLVAHRRLVGVWVFAALLLGSAYTFESATESDYFDDNEPILPYLVLTVVLIIGYLLVRALLLFATLRLIRVRESFSYCMNTASAAAVVCALPLGLLAFLFGDRFGVLSDVEWSSVSGYGAALVVQVVLWCVVVLSSELLFVGVLVSRTRLAGVPHSGVVLHMGLILFAAAALFYAVLLATRHMMY